MTRWFLALTAACSGAGAHPRDKPAPAPPPLYDRLGGMDAITELVDRALVIVAANPRLARFKVADAIGLRDHLARQLCELTGGPCKYTGRDMRAVHAGLGISKVDYAAWIADFATALDQRKLAAGDKAELLRELGALEPQILAP